MTPVRASRSNRSPRLYTSARSAAVSILAERFERRTALQTCFQSAAFLRLPPAEQLLAREIVDVVLRRLSLLDFWLESVSSRPLRRIDPLALWILRTAAAQLNFMRVPDWAAVNEAVALCEAFGRGGLKGFVNGVLRALLREGMRLPEGNRPQDLAIRYSHPLWLVRRLVGRWGVEGACRVMDRHNQHPAPVVWVNPFRIGLDEFCWRLEERGIPYAVLPGLQRAVRVEVRGFVRDPFYREGWCFFMDPASQAVAEWCDVGAARCLADLCAAPGGKAFILASRCSPEALLVCGDRHEGRLESVRRRAPQLAVPIRCWLLLDVSRTLPFAPVFDFILLDVPCSGLGTLQANPDLRWFVEEPELLRHQGRQLAMLGSAYGALAPGGRLVYATCSSEPEENEQVMAAFLARHSEAIPDGGPFRPDPEHTGTPGFYAAAIRRP